MEDENKTKENSQKNEDIKDYQEDNENNIEIDNVELTQKLIISQEEEELNKTSKSNIVQQQPLIIENLPSNTESYDKSVKIILLGDSSVGKSTILSILNQDTFDIGQRKTLGLEHQNFFLKINNLILRMQIWDTVGQENIDSITSNYYKSTDIAIFVYAINDIKSFKRIDEWEQKLYETNMRNESQISFESINNSMIKVLLGNKSDLEKERQVKFEDAEKYSIEKKFNIFQEISCKNFNIDLSQGLSNNESNNDIELNSNDNNIKKIFDNIGKLYYYQFTNTGRNNSMSYYDYQATPSMVYSTKYKGKNKAKGAKKCCCCCCY